MTEINIHGQVDVGSLENEIHFYRFRSVDALIGAREELEKQEIYFADPAQLNDAMEGFKDLFWSGDSILWENLLRHYLLCLELSFLQITVCGESKLNVESVVFKNASNLPAENLKDIHEEICRDFFENPDVGVLSTLLEKRREPVRRNELYIYLSSVQIEALACVVSCFEKHKLFSGQRPALRDGMPSFLPVASRLLYVLNENLGLPMAPEDYFEFSNLLSIRNAIALYKDRSLGGENIWTSLVLEFPEKYLTALEKLVFTGWFTACFVKDPTHAAMWGTYGDSHQGVCLKFRASPTKGAKPSLNLKRVVGWASSETGPTKHYGYVPHEFTPVSYDERYEEIDFFRSLGQIPMPTLNADWFSNREGKFSPVAHELQQGGDEWRADYWRRFSKTTCRKLSDWSYEQEFRIVLYSSLGGFEDTIDRKLVYRFEDLTGIIFGIKTPIEEKSKIVNIVERMCRKWNRPNFEFSQAFYSRETGRMVVRPLPLEGLFLRDFLL